jgi:hypothetical protein
MSVGMRDVSCTACSFISPTETGSTNAAMVAIALSCRSDATWCVKLVQLMNTKDSSMQRVVQIGEC